MYMYNMHMHMHMCMYMNMYVALKPGLSRNGLRKGVAVSICGVAESNGTA